MQMAASSEDDSRLFFIALKGGEMREKD